MYRKIIGVIGSSQPDSKTRQIAYKVGKLIAENGYPLVTGGLTGVMESVCEGAKSANGLTIGILPDEHPDNANKYIDIAIPTGFGYGRNVILVRTAAVLIAISGGYGTLSEIGFALNLRKTVISLNSWDIPKAGKVDDGLFIYATTPEEAVDKAIETINRC